jgi:hypothetical protein
VYFKSKVLAAVAALTLFGGTAAAVVTADSAGAITPSCGSSCIDVFSRQFGTHFRPTYVMDVFRQGERAGQPIILFRQSNSDPAEDFTVSFQGLVSDFFAAGLVSPQVMLHYGCTPGFAFSNGQGGTLTCAGTAQDEPAFEQEYAPYGVDSGLCVGVARTAFQNEGVTLQPCGETAKTVWILDTFDLSFPAFLTGYFPAINGSDTNFSHPFVLTYPSNGFPTDTPRPQLKVTNLTGFSNGIGPIVGTVPDNQLWGADFGVIP